MPFIVGKDEELDLIDTGFLSKARINLQSYCLMNAIEDSDLECSFALFSPYLLDGSQQVL